MTSRISHRPPPPRSLPDCLEEWVDAELITDEQARAIRQREAESHEGRPVPVPPPSTAAGPSLVVEALGYLGGVAMLVGAVILTAIYWETLSVTAQLVPIGTSAVAFVGAGFAVPDRLGGAARRLRSVLWAAGVVSVGAFLAALCDEVLLDELDRYHERQMVIGGGTAVVAAALWWLHRTWPQQLALFLPLMFAANGLGVELTAIDSPGGGAALWGVAVAWTVLAWAGWLEPRVTGVAFGLLGAVLGSLFMDNDAGVALGLMTAAAAVALALWGRSLPLLGVAAVALLATTPRAAHEWFPGRLSASLTFLIVGALLVGAAVWVAGHGHSDRPRREPGT